MYPLNLAITIVLYVILAKHSESLMNDVCDKDDFECQHPNKIDKTGHLETGKSQQDNILRGITSVSMLECIKECFVTSQCTAVNYRKNWKLCDVLADLPPGKNLQNELGSIYTKVSTWNKALAGACADHQCKKGNKCEKQTDHTICTPACFKVKGNPFIVCNEYVEWKKLFCCIEKTLRPLDCGDIPVQCPSGVYTIYPTIRSQFDVYCDMVTESGGWTVIQSRIDGSVDFYRKWTAYEDGFGNKKHEFWLGNKNIHTLTSSGDYELYIELEYFHGETTFARYSSFMIDDSNSAYKLHVDGYSGTAGDTLKVSHNGMKFSTQDRDNDLATGNNCATKENAYGAW
ncbi:Fibrinogen-like protein A,Ryncolin-4,Angiopoietin-related protein 1,Ficolin-3,Ficolin-1-B,Ficolin-2,Ryncolin-1,Tenascin-R,Fibrinogen-like protein 1,Tenascin-X,Fibrinogen C domain-containing protein 1-A,Tenascin-N,Ryncolin-3,Tenascin,Fibroleukin,Fibrinogen C domain-containing protein 1,Ryncolin-2,Fibrinogen beta chain,Angiopoietin-related protein 2,Angiopoietin-2,Microfibril-associated glycoprotein 4,Ficolin-1-A,Ficolin-1,Fibrinogen C domain-containing protein 1-B,Angiopoietin-4 [Mytilus coruscus]|uniref:Fibrinogen C-terminal domain-containing protein n=1 Tax=Mytilus coruscus TaxID=42192 RepID=A0A6J8A357_MYTCO|nr:Fibrinogen-like protein A,Ryncolin-4,Angiopoietin-related protein 1,Ficolin-3,Ficolin-1-B,Ficolin-2,Ryncolin-1,Tenascin-R,Fibrinogen-like protein 1,Tenascin-X,Fibrinogen C domain-containing protein 1-A,Tenascin-N,Ryncolin-3,Tenascin,Fibroleukin,Fibrinogen C domain-containing protein 1,Ryncolin-2,Fibrinogen beta chain,Angiopoietin-related protein 2,Angiopoietin-2,Microfibril-associated glycoprotein 4,Ficolin-1-A,Ficolin-1,Fibrinogen C domain-containing protein 1-B,Angiopoietin-4 [Mytilus coruscus